MNTYDVIENEILDEYLSPENGTAYVLLTDVMTTNEQGYITKQVVYSEDGVMKSMESTKFHSLYLAVQEDFEQGTLWEYS